MERLIICEPRHNRLINSNPTKSDEADVEGMCLLLRLGKLKEVWMGTDRTREIYRGQARGVGAMSSVVIVRASEDMSS
ncbi:MAG: hypothetical protein DMF14_03890 [Verrucomicrobia bacterium]|nr:MAG: hypothetical protein DMF14_03890 [Verrucomicrobiota bacterium]